MTMIPCPKCGAALSPSAEKCPHCGEALGKPQNTDRQPCRVCGTLLDVSKHRYRIYWTSGYTASENISGDIDIRKNTSSSIHHVPCPHCGEPEPLRNYWTETFPGACFALLAFLNVIGGTALCLTLTGILSLLIGIISKQPGTWLPLPGFIRVSLSTIVVVVVGLATLTCFVRLFARLRRLLKKNPYGLPHAGKAAVLHLLFFIVVYGAGYTLCFTPGLAEHVLDLISATGTRLGTL